MKAFKRLICSLALLILLSWSLGNAITNLQVVERNETHATLWCETDLRQIIWKIRKNGKTRRFEAKRYERNGSFVTAETKILVNETVNAICIAKTRSRSEMDRLTLHPYEVPTDSPTIVTTMGTFIDDSVPTTGIATSPTSPTVHDDRNVTVILPTPPTGEEDEHVSVPVVIGIIVAVLCLLAAVTVLVAFLYRYMQRRRKTLKSGGQQQTRHNPDVRQLQSQCPPDASTLTPVCIRAQVDESDSHTEKSTQELKDSQAQSNPEKEIHTTSCGFGPPPMSQPNLMELQTSTDPDTNQCQHVEHVTPNLDHLTDDEQSVRTPMTFVPPRPPPWRTPRHSSVQRDDGSNDAPIGQTQAQLPFHGHSEEQNSQQTGIVLEPMESASSGTTA